MPSKAKPIAEEKLTELSNALDPQSIINKNPRLRLKQKKFIKAYLEHGNGTQAVIDAGYDVKNRAIAGARANELLNSPNVAPTIAEALDTQGLTINKLTEMLDKSVHAGIGNKATNKDSLKGIEMAFKLHGLLDSKKHVENKTLNISLKVKNADDLKKLFGGEFEEIKE